MFKLSYRLFWGINLLLYVFNLCAPTYNVYAMGGAADVDVNLPIAEIEGLIQQLEDAGNNLVGQAAIQLRETIRELSEQMRQRVDQLKEAAKEVIQVAVTQLRQLLNDLIRQARALLAEINQMIRDSIQCINQALAERISQIKDSIVSILKEVADAIKEAVDHIYVRSTQLIDTGTNRVAIVINSTLVVLAKVVIIILTFLLLFWLIRALWKGVFPKNKVLRFGIPSLIVMLLVGGGYLFFSSQALAKVLGSTVSLPKWENACRDGDRLYDRFIDLKNQNADAALLKAVGDSSLEQLNWCLYASMSPEIARGTRNKIDEIAAVLYPPPPPPSVTTVTATPCNPQTPVSIDPRWIGKYDLRKILILNDLKAARVLKPTVLPMVSDTTTYLRSVRRVTRINPNVLRDMPVFRPQ